MAQIVEGSVSFLTENYAMMYAVIKLFNLPRGAKRC